jgi:hypothetical protein
MKIRRPSLFVLAVVVGGALGAALGDGILPEGYDGTYRLFSDLVFAIGGGFLIGVLYEVAVDLSSSRAVEPPRGFGAVDRHALTIERTPGRSSLTNPLVFAIGLAILIAAAVINVLRWTG